MAHSALVAFATMYGSTKEVAEAIASTLRNAGLDVDLKDAGEVKRLDGYDAVVLGAPLIINKLHKDARRFLSRNQKALEKLPVALFALGPCKDPHNEDEWKDCRAQLDKVLAEVAWLQPVAAELFGGRFDPALLKFPFSKMAGSEPASDARDWGAIEAWAAGLPALLGLAAQPIERSSV
ncbi:MAG: flavodoxin domain-containing protein [Coriobacteriia bacterium]